jgi:MoxR-like ATPase
MALCAYCGKVEVAWYMTGRVWVACHARRDETGEVMRAAVRSGLRTVMRPVPNPTARHYPVLDVAAPTVTECPSWRPDLAAAARMKRKGWRRGPAPEAASVAVASIASAAPIPTATIDAAAPTAPTSGPARPGVCAAGPARLPEPEEMLSEPERAAWTRAEAAIACGLLPTRVMLWGPPGTGKTELPWRIAKRLGWQHIYQLMTEETPAVEMLGHLIVQDGSTVWCDGTLGRAIRASQAGPVVYVVDEIGRASQDAMSACLLALTNPESLRLTLRSGEVLTPNAAHWHCVATSNDDPSMLAPALSDRLHIAVKIVAPHPELVRSMTTVEARRLACAHSREYSIRALLTYDRLRAAGMALREAASLVWEPEVASSFADAARLEAGR